MKKINKKENRKKCANIRFDLADDLKDKWKATQSLKCSLESCHSYYLVLTFLFKA